MSISFAARDKEKTNPDDAIKVRHPVHDIIANHRVRPQALFEIQTI
ncbi:MAG TPA: hypothetical protein VGF82_20880 [Terracidiphilus sp.]|jgi:hypothetical protein